MKRRRWWFIGLALALLSACVFAWKWTERPPYKFMEGADLYFVEERDYWNPGIVVTYTSSRSFAEVRKRAIGELGRPSVDSKDRLKFGNVSVVPADKWDVNSTTDSAYWPFRREPRRSSGYHEGQRMQTPCGQTRFG